MWNNFVMYIMSLSQKGTIQECRCIADFFNSSMQMINEGILPGNKVQPYMLRKILRIMFDMCEKLGISISNLVDEYLNYNSLSIDKITIYQEI